MKKFLEKYFNYIVFTFLIIVMLKGCNEVRVLNEVQDNIQSLKDSTFTKVEYQGLYVLTQDLNNKFTEREALRSELRFYQSTDRKLLDVQRQSVVEEKIKVLDKEINELERELYERVD